MMTESKIELTHRLEREGRWNEASEFRDRVRREQREAGQSRAAANEAAWNRMAEEFPPLPTSNSNAELDDPFCDDVNDSDLPADLLVGGGNFEDDLQWAYRNICSDASREDAPSGAAWLLRQWGRDPDSRDKFLNFVAKTQLRRRDEDERLKDDARCQFELLSLFGPMDDVGTFDPRPKISVAEALNRLSKLPPEAMVTLEVPTSSPRGTVAKRDFLNEPVD